MIVPLVPPTVWSSLPPACTAAPAPREADELLAQLAAFLNVGRVLSSDRRNLEIEFQRDGTAALRYDWSVELRLRNLERVVQLSLPCTATAEAHQGKWVLAGFRSTE